MPLGRQLRGCGLFELYVVTERAKLSESTALDVLGAQVSERLWSGVVVELAGGETTVGSWNLVSCRLCAGS